MSLLNNIRKCIDTAPPAVAAVGDWILRHPARAATLGVEEIAAQSGASSASVSRLARAAGYSGFIPMKAALLQSLRDAVEPIKKLQDERGRANASMATYVAMAQVNIDGLGRANTGKAFTEAAALLSSSERIFVLGMGLTSNVAGWFVDTLSTFTGNVVSLAHSGGTERCAARLSRISRRDVLVVLTLPRYSQDSVTLASYAKHRGAKVLAITDSIAAPVLSHSDKGLFVPSAHAVFSSSYVSMQLVCEALAAEVVCRDPDSVKVATQLTDAILSRLTFSSN